MVQGGTQLQHSPSCNSSQGTNVLFFLSENLQKVFLLFLYSVNLNSEEAQQSPQNLAVYCIMLRVCTDSLSLFFLEYYN